MTDRSCPYCNSAQSLLLGNVYCSHQGSGMQELETGTLFIRSKKLEETADHVSRLSIRCILKGQQYYRVGGNDHRITPENFLVVNQGQTYRTSFQDKEELEMILVAFKPGFAEGLLHALVTPADKLLADPFHTSPQPVCFFERTYEADGVIRELFRQLRALLDKDILYRRSVDLDEMYTQMLTRLLQLHRNLYPAINRLGGMKASTRYELYRRLSIAKDLMDARLDRKMGIDEIAQAACLSPHHFKRAFKKAFGITPHRYHVKKRLEQSCRLILRRESDIAGICQQVGFEDSSSFIRLFRREFGCTPGAYTGLS